MNVKRIFLILIITVFLGECFIPMTGDCNSLTKVFVNGVKLSVYPKTKDGIAYLPANTMASSLGIRISWNGQTRILKINDKVVAVSPLVENGMLYLPVESICTYAGAVVEWDGSRNAILITHSGGSSVTVADSGDTGGSLTENSYTPQPVVQVTPVAKKTPTPNTVTVTPTPVKVTPVPASTPQDYTVSDVSAPTPGTYYQNTSSGSSSGGPGKSGSTSSSGSYSPTPPTTYSGQPSGSAYPSNRPDATDPLRPLDAPPKLTPNLSLPPMSNTGQVSSPTATYSSTSPFIPRSESNDVFRITVTNMEYVDAIKDYYKPKPGYKFIIVYLSQQNISDEVQIYTGRFSLLDQGNHSYDYIEGLSNFWLVILRPGGINFGYLVFEIPNDAKPMNMVLHGLNAAPLSVALR